MPEHKVVIAAWRSCALFVSTFCPAGPERTCRQLIAIWPGNTKSQMKQQGGSCKSHITKSPLKAQEHCSAMTSSLIACLQSRRRQEAVIPISCLRHSPGGRRHNGGVKEKSHIYIFFFSFFHVWNHSFSQGRRKKSIVIVPASVSPELMKRDYNGTGITFVRMWTLTMTKLLSWKHWWWVCWCQGWFGWKLNKGRQKGRFQTINTHLIIRAWACFCIFCT